MEIYQIIKHYHSIKRLTALSLFFSFLSISAFSQTYRDMYKAWYDLPLDWKMSLSLNQLKDTVMHPSDAQICEIFGTKEFSIDARSEFEITDLSGCYFLRHASQVNIKDQCFDSLNGARYLDDQCRLNFYNNNYDITSEAFYNKNVLSIQHKEILFGEIRLGERYVDAARINRAYVLKRALVWLVDLDSMQQRIVKGIIGFPADSTMYLKDVQLLNTMFHKPDMELDLGVLDKSGQEKVNLEFLNILINLRVLKIRNGEYLANLNFISQLKNMRVIIANKTGIRSLKGIEHLKKLSSLEIYSNKIHSLGFIKKSYEIQSLNISNNEMKNVDSLVGLNRLNLLISNDNKLENIKGLDSLNLRYLYLNNNRRLKDYSQLVTTLKLEELYLNNSRVGSLEALRNLKSLKKLSLRFNSIRDICPITRLQNIEYLDLRGNDLSNISCIDNLQNIRFLNISENRIQNLNFITFKFKKLETLLCDYNEISVLPIMENLTKLREFRISHNRLRNLMPLSDLQKLEILAISNNSAFTSITKFPEFNLLYRLKELYFFENNISYKVRKKKHQQLLEKVKRKQLDALGIW